MRDVRNLLHTVNRPLLNKLHGFPVVDDVTIRELRPKQKHPRPQSACANEHENEQHGEDAQEFEEVVRTLQVYQGTILVDSLCALLRTKRFYHRRLAGSSDADKALPPAMELAISPRADHIVPVEASNGSSVSDQDSEGTDDHASTDLEMQSLQRTPASAPVTGGAAVAGEPCAPQESPAQAFARMTLAALNKRADAADMIVEQALLQLETGDLDMWLDIGESMNRAAYVYRTIYGIDAYTFNIDYLHT